MKSQDVVPMPLGFDRVTLSNSFLHGTGMFTTCLVQAGELLAPARLHGLRTPAGRFTNHSARPNAVFERIDKEKNNSDLNLVAIKIIHKGSEILIDYRQAVIVSGIGMTASPAEVLKTKYLPWSICLAAGGKQTVACKRKISWD